jgi:hypothetical protein
MGAWRTGDHDIQIACPDPHGVREVGRLERHHIPIHRRDAVVRFVRRVAIRRAHTPGRLRQF